MQKQSIIVAVIVFVLIVFGMFIFTYLKQQELQTPPVTASLDEAPMSNTYNIFIIDGMHYFIDGVHTVVGEVLMPTPCDLVDVSTQVRESFPEQISLDFVVINESEMCAQVMTTQRFMAVAEASEEATFSATFMGEPVTLNLIPAPEGAVPEEFEMYIKG